MEHAIVFCLLTLAGVNLAAPSEQPCPLNEEFRPHGGPACENCGARCLATIPTAKCYCKSGYSRVYGNCIPDEACSSPPSKFSGPSQTQRKPMENLGMYDGDMLGVELDEDRNAVANTNRLWPDGVIPYVIDDKLSGDELNSTHQGMKYIMERTCIKFVPRTVERDYVRMIYGDGCYSYWGRIGSEQLLSIGNGCGNLPTAIHELLHAIGFEHEHRRSDRDDYVIIFWNNIDPKQQHNFRKLRPHQNRLLTPFDYDSIMLYGSLTFANRWAVYSMAKKNLDILPEVNTKKGMSASDIKRVKMLYQCSK